MTMFNDNSGKSNLDRRDFIKLVGGAAAAAGVALPFSSCQHATAATRKKVVVLGLDGLDPYMVYKLIEEGRAPNFKKLAEMGHLGSLGTTIPALSPVAWSSFITGKTPGGHGIADFIMRDPKEYNPVFSIYETREADLTLPLGNLEIPISGGGAYNMRHGKPFWSYLTENGIPATVIKIPTNFPVDETATRAISGMGTPDIADAYGMFSYYTSNPFETYSNISGGRVFYVDNDNNKYKCELTGPVNSFVRVKDGEEPEVVKVPFTVYADERNKSARIEIQDNNFVLKEGEFSDWVHINFEMVPLLGSVSGIARFYLRKIAGKLQLYVTPINIDPSNQAMPVTHPADYGAELAREIGNFWTKGLPSDTKAFDVGIFKDEDYVKQAQLVLQERLDLFRYEWSRFNSGFLFFYVSSTDQDAHMLWRNMDTEHPMHGVADKRFSNYLYYLYEEMDKMVGTVLTGLDDDMLLLIVSDHGFAQFGRQFHLNTWLRREGYLVMKDSARRKPKTSLRDVDWSKSVAYGIGFNGLYLNMKGREGQGIIEPGKEGKYINDISSKLVNILDPETGKRPVFRVYDRNDVYSGEMTSEMPEMLVGYERGYRNSGDSVLGETGESLIEINPFPWSGDHSMARDLVPGTLGSSKPIKKQHPNILDLPVTILDYFGIPKPDDMVGGSIFNA